MERYRRQVFYYETDKMGVTHHSNYVRFMEEARIDFLEQIGCSYDKMEKAGIISPVIWIECEYKRSTTFGDELRISQVILNLLTNAVKYTEKGSITLTVSDTNLEDGQFALSVAVKDTGIGMSDTFQEHIFEMFERERTAANSNIQGTGLGLAIAKSFTELQNGKFDVEIDGDLFKVTIIFNKNLNNE